MRRWIVAAALALAACGQPQQGETNEASPVASAPNYDATIGPTSAAGISAALPMNVEAVTAAAPNYIVAEVDDQIEGNAFKAITLSAGDEEVFRVLPTADRRNIHAIVTRSSQARSPAGEIPGQSKDWLGRLNFQQGNVVFDRTLLDTQKSVLYVKGREGVSRRELFDAAPPVLAEMTPAPAFAL